MARPWFRWLSVGVAALVGASLPGLLVVTTTPSVDARVLVRAPGAPGPGDWVTFELVHPRLPDGRGRLTKRVGCGPGQVLGIEGLRYTCDGRLLGVAKTRARDGTRTRRFQEAGPVPAGKLFVVGGHPDSFDSRYFGFIDQAAAEPLVKLW